MRVIAGSAKGRTLKGPKRLTVRPTSDKVRGAIFSMLGDVVPGARVLDLFAGTGALGIEALSRGAQHVDFVEADPQVARIIRENLELTGLSALAKVHARAVEDWLVRLCGQSAEGDASQPVDGLPYDIVLMDPPYAYAGVERVVHLVLQSRVLGLAGILVIEHSSRVSLADAYGDLQCVRQRRYGDSAVALYERGMAA